MFVLCPECHNHYDDTCRSAECNGPGTGRGHRPTAEQPVMEHRHNTALANDPALRKALARARTARASTRTPKPVPTPPDTKRKR